MDSVSEQTPTEVKEAVSSEVEKVAETEVSEVETAKTQESIPEGVTITADEGQDSRKIKVSKKEDQKKEIDLDQEPKANISIRTMLEAGVHFGHQTSRWDPRMEPYIYSARNGIHIVDLPKTHELWKKAKQSIVEIVARGGNVLFVGTKKQAQDVIFEEAHRCLSLIHI